MIAWSKLLVVDDSEVYRRVMATSLRPYCASLLTASGVEEARKLIADHEDLDLIICDVVMQDGEGWEVLEAVQELPEPKPRVLMVTGFAAEQGAERAFRLGAIDYLRKPTSVREILRAVGDPAASGSQHKPRWRSSGHAYLIQNEPDTPECIQWDIYNISPTGAFLETKGPVPVGAILELRLELEGGRADVRARVVRVQEPSWTDVGGIGVTFLEISDEAREVVSRTIGA